MSSSTHNFQKLVKINPNQYQIKSVDSSSKKTIDQNVILSPPNSTTSSNQIRVSQGSLNGARPLLVPTVTPKTKSPNNNQNGDEQHPVLPLPSYNNNKKLPDGVVAVPVDKHSNDKPEENVNNRYLNKIEVKKPDEGDNDNGAHEEFDQPQGFNFGDGGGKHLWGIGAQHINQLAMGDADNDYKNNNDVQLEDINDPDDGKVVEETCFS